MSVRRRRLPGPTCICPFDLSRGPLLRAQLVRLSAHEHLLLVNVHHIVFDGWSMGLLLEELEEHYRSLIAGDEADVAELPLQYADYAVWQASGSRARNWIVRWGTGRTGWRVPPRCWNYPRTDRGQRSRAIGGRASQWNSRPT